MKNLRFVALLLCLCLVCSPSFGQKIGIRGGASFSNILEKDNYYTYSTENNLNAGLHFGPIVEFELAPGLDISTGLLLSSKGARYHDEILGNDVLVKMKLAYLEIPVQMKTSYSFGTRQKVFLTVGPYIALGAAGEIDATATYSGGVNTGGGQIRWGYDPESDDLRNIDYGISLGTGFELGDILISFIYAHGLANISSYQDYGTSIKNKSFRISGGYFFIRQ